MAASLARSMPGERSGVRLNFVFREKKLLPSKGFACSPQRCGDRLSNPRTCQGLRSAEPLIPSLQVISEKTEGQKI